MRSFGKFLGRLLVLLCVLGGTAWIFGPYEVSEFNFSFQNSELQNDIDAYFESSEARFDDITPGTEKRVVWAGPAGAKTDIALVYLHGFSASSEEIRPVPERVAAALGANLVLTRLQGHGRGGEALATATVAGWTRDTAEAIFAAQQIGQRVIVLSTSTGGTLAAAAAHEPELMQQVAGMIFVSPNFGVNSPFAGLLTWPAARYWLPPLLGETYSYEPANEDNARYWTTSYPSVAVLPMAALVDRVTELDASSVSIPALFWYSEADQVVRADATDRIAAAWGGPVTRIAPQLTDRDDPFAHVTMGDILSPNQTEPAIAAMVNWIKGLD